MTDTVRILNADGMARVERYLNQLRGGLDQPPPADLLFSPAYTSVVDPAASVEKKLFGNRYEFGTYLAGQLSHSRPARDFPKQRAVDMACAVLLRSALPAAANGTRKARSIQAYVLPIRYDYRIYYRHLVRTPWLVALDHGAFAKVLLIPTGASDEAPLATRGEIIEQMASRQDYLGNPAIIEAAYRLYFDEQKGKPRRGAGGSAGGSPRRLATILQQLGLTFDLGACVLTRYRSCCRRSLIAGEPDDEEMLQPSLKPPHNTWPPRCITKSREHDPRPSKAE